MKINQMKKRTELQKDINDCISISLAVIASILGTHCHISIAFLTDKQTNKQILTATKKYEDPKPPSTSILIDTNGTGSEEASRRSRGQRHMFMVNTACA